MTRRWGSSLIVLTVLLGVAAAGQAQTVPRTILVIGDSLSAGYGVPLEQGWVRLLRQRLAQRAPAYRVVNASISGDTTRGGLERLGPALARYQPDIVILELGGNDGLRGLSLEQTHDNLAGMIEKARDGGARVLLVGMRLPPNYGPAYTQRFHDIYPELARHYGIALVPFLLEGVAGREELMQADGIHPRPAGQPRLLDNVWPYLKPLLGGQASAADAP